MEGAGRAGNGGRAETDYAANLVSGPITGQEMRDVADANREVLGYMAWMEKHTKPGNR